MRCAASCLPHIEEELEVFQQHNVPCLLMLFKIFHVFISTAQFSCTELFQLSYKQRAEGPATILAIRPATAPATAPNCFPRADYPDYYFHVRKSEHQTQLKEEFKLICEKTMIKTRYFHLTEEMVAENPNKQTYNAPSLDTRQKMLIIEVPKLGAKAATKGH